MNTIVELFIDLVILWGTLSDSQQLICALKMFLIYLLSLEAGSEFHFQQEDLVSFVWTFISPRHHLYLLKFVKMLSLRWNFKVGWVP